MVAVAMKLGIGRKANADDGELCVNLDGQLQPQTQKPES